MKTFEQLQEEIAVLVEKKGDDAEYKAKVKKLLDEFGVDSPEDLSDEDKKKFFDKLDASHKSDKEEKGIKEEDESDDEEDEDKKKDKKEDEE